MIFKLIKQILQLERFLRSFGFILPLLLLSAKVSFTATQYPPNLHWQQISTEHFIIVYHQGEEEIAQHVAGFVERVHDQVTGFLDYTPKGKTYVVLTDHVDYSNAIAYVFPRNKVVLYLYGPVGAAESKNLDYLQYVFTHEYTHIVHLNCIRGIPKILRWVMGSWVVPNATVPAWAIEGIATYTEGKFQYGRVEDPEYEMMIRADVLDGRFKRLDEPTDFGVRKWPGGTMRYLYGSMFYRYLDEQYGDHNIARANKIYSGQIPYFTSLSYRKSFVKSLPRLWKEWCMRAETFYSKQVDSLATLGLSRTTALSNQGYYTSQPVFSAKGEKLFYLHAGGDHYPAIYVIDCTTGKKTMIVEGRFSGRQFSLSPDGKNLYFAQYSPYKKFYTFSDIFVHDLTTGQTHQLTHGMRAFDPTVSPDGNILVFVSDELGTMKLQAIDLSSFKIRTLFDPTEKTQFHHPNFSPDGNRLVFSFWQNGQLDIAVCDSNGEKFQLITHDRHTDMHPVWTPDGRHILFYSDRTGVPNLFIYDLPDKDLFQVTNVATGVFNPAVSSDGKQIAMAYYSSRGYDIHVTDVDTAQWRPTKIQMESILNTKSDNVKNSPQPYNPFPSLVPKFWIPMLSSDAYGDQYGIYTFNNDILEKHYYDLYLLYGLDSRYLSYFLTYENDCYLSTLTLSIADFHRGYSDCSWDINGLCGVNYWERIRSANFSARFPISRRIRSNTDFSVAFRYENWSKIGFTLRSDAAIHSRLKLPVTGNWTSLSANLMHSRLESYRYSISPEKGYRLRIGVERADPILGGDFQVWKFVSDVAFYLRSPIVRHVFAFKLSGGTGCGDFIPQGIYHLGGSFGIRTMTLRSRYFQLRGYPQNAFSGKHALLGTIEYRFPLFFVERGIHTWPVFWDGMSAALFAEAGHAWQKSSLQLTHFNYSAGAELQLNLSFLRIMPTRFAFGFAKGFGERGMKKWYFRIDSSIPYQL